MLLSDDERRTRWGVSGLFFILPPISFFVWGGMYYLIGALTILPLSLYLILFFRGLS